MIYAPFALFLLFVLEADLTGRVFFVVAWYRGTLCRVSSFLNSHLAFHSYGCFGVRQRRPVNMHLLMGCNVSQPVRPRALFKSNQREITVERETIESRRNLYPKQSRGTWPWLCIHQPTHWWGQCICVPGQPLLDRKMYVRK